MNFTKKVQCVKMAIRERKSSITNYYKNLKFIKSAYRRNTNGFLQNSSIHGLHYFNKEDLNIVERLYFILTFVVVVALSIYFISNVTEKWSYSPTIISLDPEPDYITDDPFPTLTICNMNQALKSKVANFSRYSQDYAMLQTLCGRKANVTIIDSIKNWASLKDFVTNVSQPCERMLLNCKYGGTKYNCSHIFRPIFTSEGICCIFNALDPLFSFVNGDSGLDRKIHYPPGFKPVGWTMDNGYDNPLPKYFFPMKAVGKGQLYSLTVTMNVEMDEYFCSSSNSFGFKIAAHNPNERPDVLETGLLISPGLESFIRVIPDKMSADEKLRLLKPKARNCIFSDELNLKTFLHYSHVNCMYECRIEMTLHYCGCIDPYMAPRSPNSSVCRYDSLHCLQEIKLAAKMDEFGCGQRCWHDCVSKQHSMDIFAAPLENGAMEYIAEIFDNRSIDDVKKNIAIANFYIESLTFISSIQSPYIGPLNVLSSIGGIICVFCGFSFISLAEIIYYTCIRPWRTIKKTQLSTSRTNVGNCVQKSSKQLANRYKVHFVNPYGRNCIYTINLNKNRVMPFNRGQMQ